MAAGSLPRERIRGESVVAYDLRPFVVGLDVSEGPGAGAATLRMTLRHDPERGIGRPDETLAALGGLLGRDIAVTALVRESLVLADPPSAAPPPPRRGPKPPRPLSRGG
jgi:hypothetical protein